ncbi:imm11 family protein [Paenibacillus barengoltzii]|uniref:imm11 family protein n=1 Tax=Paenibacillus barengoltzii TaxID=343517 RepID=UPI002FD969E9
MKVYELRNHIKSMVITSDNDKSHPITSAFDGVSKLAEWTPIKVKTISKKSYRDFPDYRIGKPVISARVKEVIEPFVRTEVEFLPLMHEELDLYMVNVTNVLDCVDWKRSDFESFEDGTLAGFNKLVFDFTKIPKWTYIFKFKERATTRVYVTEAFKDLIESHKFKGLDFSVVFDSAFTEEKEQEQKRNYELALEEIERKKGEEFSYEEARERVDKGQAVASGKWKMQLDEKGRFWLGELTLDLTYQWIMPIYTPPILLSYLWHEVEKSEIK